MFKSINLILYFYNKFHYLNKPIKINNKNFDFKNNLKNL